MDQKYWDEFYSTNDVTNNASNFAKFCIKKIDQTFGTIIDVGCGNGRDTKFFCNNNIKCIGVDQSSEVIKLNKIESRDNNVKFMTANFTSMDYSTIVEGNISIYSRFTLHALNYDEEFFFLKSIIDNDKLKYLMIEARSINDALYGIGKEVGKHEYISSHYRRFIDPDDLQKKLSKNFRILFFEENKGFSKTDDDDPCLIRILAIKN